MDSPVSRIDLIVLVTYLGAMVFLGCAMVKKSRRSEEFMAAGRSLPGWAVGLSIFGSYVSSISFLANPGKSYAANWNPFVFSLSLPLAAWIATRYFVPFFRRDGEISAYTHLEHRFGLWARTYAVACFLLLQLGRVATILYLVALALSPLLGWDIPTIIIVTGILVTIYTLLGGIEAVIWTDVVQSLLLTGGIFLAIGTMMWQMPAGEASILEIAWENNKFSLGSFTTSLGESTFWVVLFYGLFINLQNFAVDQTYVQRYVTAKSDEAANQSVWLGALLYVPISGLLFFVGTALFAFYSVQPELLVTATGETLKSDAVFPHFIATELPVGLSGLVIAAILAAAMSSVDSSLNCSATLLLCDVYRRYIQPNASERESMRILYGSTLLCGIAGTIAGLAMMNAKQVLDVWWKIAGVAGGGLLGLFLLGFFSQRVTSRHAVAALVVGVCTIVWMTFSPMEIWPAALERFQSPFHAFLTIVFGTSSIVITGLCLARWFPDHSAPHR